MELISSDTNIWIDFSDIGFLHVPFLLLDKYQFIISTYSLEQELLYPADLRHSLLELGLIPVEVDAREISLSEIYTKYSALSLFDRLALAIAKNRGIILLTGDGPLRKAACIEKVEVHGTLWVIDETVRNDKISQETYIEILEQLSSNPKIRLPQAEITRRISQAQ